MNVNWVDRREELTETDIIILSAMLQVQPRLSKMLVSGEVDIHRFTDIELISLGKWNSMLEEKHSVAGLFIYTHYGTVRMRRFTRTVILDLLNEHELKDVLQVEAARLGVYYWIRPTSEKPFSYGLLEANKLLGKMAVPNRKGIEHADTLYMNGLTLFGKQDYQHRPAESFFCHINLADFDFVELTDEQKEAVDDACTNDVRYVTTKEELCILDIVFGLSDDKIV